MRKRIFSVALLLVTVMTLFIGCGSSQKTYGDYTEKDVMNIMIAFPALIFNDDKYVSVMTDADMMMFNEVLPEDEKEQSAVIWGFYEQLDSVMGELGEYKDIEQGSFTIDRTGKTYTAKINVAFSDRDAVITAVFTAYNMKMESITIEPIYTVGEKMSKAALNTIMGIGIVFIMLAVISLVIKAFELINKVQAEGPKKQAEPAVVPGPIIVPAEDDDEIVAVIVAAIAAATGRTTDDFVVRTIKRR